MTGNKILNLKVNKFTSVIETLEKALEQAKDKSEMEVTKVVIIFSGSLKDPEETDRDGYAYMANNLTRADIMWLATHCCDMVRGVIHDAE